MSSSSLSISVKIDQKAALLAGRVLEKTAMVEVSPESIGDQWPALVGMLDMSATPPTADVTVDDPTAEAVRAVLVKRAEETAAEETEAKARLAKQIEETEAALAAVEAAVAGPMEPQPRFANTDLSGFALHGAFEFSGFKRELPYLSISTYGLPEDSPMHALKARHKEMVARNEAEVAAADQAAFEAAMPELLRLKAEKEAADAAAKAEADAQKKAMFAKRLETGTWEKETGSYNERRYGAWWVAKVDFSSGAKGDYTFGESSGSWGKAGVLSVDCQPGEFIAYGQKDLRRPGNSTHYILRMRADGSMESFGDKADAYRAYREGSAAGTRG